MSESTQKQEPQPVPQIVAEEQAILANVHETLAKFSKRGTSVNYDDKLIELRDALNEERLPEDRASIIEQMVRVSYLQAQQVRSIQQVVSPANPYFGHMRLKYEDGRDRDVMIGKETFVRKGATIVDWRHAPIARIFYQYREGDDFELEIAEREVAGQVAARRTVSIVHGEVQRVGTVDRSFVRTSSGWHDLSDREPLLSGGVGLASRPETTRSLLGVRGGVPTVGGDRQERVDKHLPEIASLLDPEQYKLITGEDSGVVAIQGSAGSGKTTVALHRVAYLSYTDPKRYKPNRSLVIVFSRALAAYISQVLPALGVQGVDVTTYETWVRTQRRRHFPKLPNTYNDDTPAIVTRLKLHAALMPILLEAAATCADHDPMELFDEFFTNRTWLGEAFAAHAPGAFSDGQLDSVHQWCTRQHFNRVDGGGAMDHEVPALDPEDDTILLRLFQMLRGPLRYKGRRPLRYNHLVVDEIQDFSPLELKVLLDTVRPGHPVTFAGDTAQTLSEEGDFQDWQYTLQALDLEQVKHATLQVSYRSTAEIMQVAREITAPLQQDSPVVIHRHGTPVELFRFASRGQAMTFLSDALKDLSENEPLASVALLARHAEQADDVYSMLVRTDLPRLRRVRDQDFVFAPGIDVTDIRQAKGLEFDYVVMLDCDCATYPVSPASRHLLHVGITRAAHQCWLVSVGPPSPLLPLRLLRTDQ